MGKPINKNTKNLDELLGHLSAPSDDLDAFENEALEGFAMLENKQEIIDLKKHLDEKIEKGLFAKKRKPLFIYWSAAAGLVLLISLIFIFNSTNSFEKKDLAQNNRVETKIQKPENSIPPPPAELSKAAKSETKSQEATNTMQKDVSRGNNSESHEQQVASGKTDETAALAESNDQSVAYKEEGEKNDKRSEPKQAADNLSNNKIPGNEPSSSMAAGSGSNKEEKAKSKNEDDESSTNTADAVFARRIKKEKGISDTKKALAAPQKSHSDNAGPYEKSNIKTAGLTISESDLNKLITKFLADKGYKKSFSCTLTINNSNKVEEIVFDNEELFKKSEIKEITAFFKKQKCFKNNEYALYSTYKVNYVSE